MEPNVFGGEFGDVVWKVSSNLVFPYICMSIKIPELFLTSLFHSKSGEDPLCADPHAFQTHRLHTHDGLGAAFAVPIMRVSSIELA